MNRRALILAGGMTVLGVVMLVFGIRDIAGFNAPSTDIYQTLTLGQVVDVITAAGLLILAGLIVVGQLQARRRATKHRQWVDKHPL